MSSVYLPTITTAGLSAAISQNALGLKLEITHVQVGAASYTPTAGQSTLVDPRHSGLVLGSSASGNQVTGTARIMSAGYTGARFDVCEIGFWAGDPNSGGTLVMVMSTLPTAPYAVMGSDVRTDLLMLVTLQLDGVPAGSITLVMDPQAAFAASLMAQHLSAANPHPQYDGVPIGTVLPFTGATPPRGFVMVHGWLLQRSEYPELWAFAQAQGVVVSEAEWFAGAWGSYSSGDGSTTFRVPDWRAEFIRFADFGRGVDSGRALGSTQDWATGRPRTRIAQAITDAGATQDLRGPGQAVLPAAERNPSQLGFARVSKSGSRVTASASDASNAGFEMDVINVAAGDAETRPRNVACAGILKASGGTASVAAPVTSAPAPSPAPAPTPSPAPAPAPSTPPVANWMVTPRFMAEDGYTGVNFTDMSTSGGSPIVAWQWVLTDTTSGQTPVTLTEQHPFYRFQSLAATWDVELTVTDANGYTSTLSRAGWIIIGGISHPGGF